MKVKVESSSLSIMYKNALVIWPADRTSLNTTDWPSQIAMLRGVDSNHWPSGYEPDELPTALPRNAWRVKTDSNRRPWGNTPTL